MSRNPDYVPRNEPPSWAAGGKVVKVDRVEWLFVPDDMTKAAALASGEADWWENPAPDIWPVLAANPEITLAELDPLGSMGTLRFNQLHPPFDNVKMRQAVLAVAEPRKSRSTRAAGMSSAQAGSAPTCCIRG
jgi:peptide/nickel transport system substrate-binding protein